MRVIIASLFFLLNANAFAGQGSGGGLGKQLQEIALSETMLSTAGMAEIYSIPKLNLDSSRIETRSPKMMMESFSEAPAGILIEVQPSDFDLVATDAANGKDFVYHDAVVRATAIDPESKTVAMTLVDDPSVTIVVKDAESK